MSATIGDGHSKPCSGRKHIPHSLPARQAVPHEGSGSKGGCGGGGGGVGHGGELGPAGGARGGSGTDEAQRSYTSWFSPQLLAVREVPHSPSPSQRWPRASVTSSQFGNPSMTASDGQSDVSTRRRHGHCRAAITA